MSMFLELSNLWEAGDARRGCQGEGRVWQGRRHQRHWRGGCRVVRVQSLADVDQPKDYIKSLETNITTAQAIA